MRRENRRQERKNSKSIWYLTGSVIGLAVIAFVLTLIIYSNKINEQVSESRLDNSKIAEIIQNSTTQSASTEMGKTVEESKNEMKNSVENTVTITNTEINNEVTKTTDSTKKETKSTEITKKTENTENEVKPSENKVKETKKEEELTFIKPVEGELQKGFAKDTLMYSETLGEWSIHLGIDIKADTTTVVKASANGKVKSIKNDPRYGLSVIIEHKDGYETLYSNLLTAEFVKVGEEVKQGQTIGTVGNTATFEVADAPHLHFEVSKDGVQQDPSLLFEI